LFGERSWLHGADAGGRAAAWWMLDGDRWDALGTMAPGAGPASGALPDAGYFVGREDASPASWFCLVDAGPHGGDRTGHAHTDVGHIEVAHGAVHVLRDPGCASYTTSIADRHWSRSEAAHACLVIDGVPLALPRGAFSWQRIPNAPRVQSGDDDTRWWCELSYRRPGVSGSVVHTRQVVLVRGCGVLVADWIQCDAPVSFALHWPFATTDVTLDGNVVHADGFLAQWAVTSGRVTQANLTAVRSSPGYAREVEAAMLRVPVRCESDASIVTAFTETGVEFAAEIRPGGALRGELRGTRRWAVDLRAGRAPDVTAIAE
jgi:hypothetical protein